MEDYAEGTIGAEVCFYGDPHVGELVRDGLDESCFLRSEQSLSRRLNSLHL